MASQQTITLDSVRPRRPASSGPTPTPRDDIKPYATPTSISLAAEQANRAGESTGNNLVCAEHSTRSLGWSEKPPSPMRGQTSRCSTRPSTTSHGKRHSRVYSQSGTRRDVISTRGSLMSKSSLAASVTAPICQPQPPSQAEEWPWWLGRYSGDCRELRLAKVDVGFMSRYGGRTVTTPTLTHACCAELLMPNLVHRVSHETSSTNLNTFCSQSGIESEAQNFIADRSMQMNDQGTCADGDLQISNSGFNSLDSQPVSRTWSSASRAPRSWEDSGSACTRNLVCAPENIEWVEAAIETPGEGGEIRPAWINNFQVSKARVKRNGLYTSTSEGYSTRDGVNTPSPHASSRCYRVRSKPNTIPVSQGTSLLPKLQGTMPQAKDQWLDADRFRDLQERIKTLSYLHSRVNDKVRKQERNLRAGLREQHRYFMNPDYEVKKTAWVVSG
eukprot:CAMPEP_0114235614 /NCGR_PEP_ID=MMETSP0058-20121206/6349_1 /TAXON_ID=36894 /ORGANISM="Pyramimonas parkeae, CCMP726" /LENGTH=443 /DNA_ID=CAMNT_0001347397 /DNA_START=8 /DNA_END=1339 /DNA_ORIENTATION=-